jgi:hypothetical protein
MLCQQASNAYREEHSAVVFEKEKNEHVWCDVPVCEYRPVFSGLEDVSGVPAALVSF